MDEEIKNAIVHLRNGGTIIYPTDTIWGIGCDASNPKAVEKVIRLKKRSESKSLIVLVSDERMLERYVQDIPLVAFELLQISDKPLTIVYDNARGLAEMIYAADGSAAIRIPQDDFCVKMIARFGKPIVSTSANLSGEMPPSSFRQISREIIANVDYVVKWKQNAEPGSKASSVIKLKSNGEFQIIRK